MTGAFNMYACNRRYIVHLQAIKDVFSRIFLHTFSECFLNYKSPAHIVLKEKLLRNSQDLNLLPSKASVSYRTMSRTFTQTLAIQTLELFSNKAK
jgi:hypothetical protein